MSIPDYEDAVRRLEGSGRTLRRSPATAPQVRKFETLLRISLPKDYDRALREFGVMKTRGMEIYGIPAGNVEAQGIPAAAWITGKHREAGLISETMVEIMSSGYGPVFVLDCAKAAETGEAPVLMVPLEGYRSPDVKTVAESFGAFLLAEVRASLERGGASTA